jgi:rubredoxin
VKPLERHGALLGGMSVPRYRCLECGHTSTADEPPPLCPACGAETWLRETWRPSAHAGRAADQPLVREAEEPSVFPGVPLS